MRTTWTLLLALLAVPACGDDPTDVDRCMLQALPLTGAAQAPTVTDVRLEIQSGVGVVVLATATDPQGDDDLLDVMQSVGVFPDAECQGSPLVVTDDLAGSGVEESFGTAVSESGQLALFSLVEAASSWPVEVTFSDVGGHVTSGRLAAPVVR